MTGGVAIICCACIGIAAAMGCPKALYWGCAGATWVTTCCAITGACGCPSKNGLATGAPAPPGAAVEAPPARKGLSAGGPVGASNKNGLAILTP